MLLLQVLNPIYFILSIVIAISPCLLAFYLLSRYQSRKRNPQVRPQRTPVHTQRIHEERIIERTVERIVLVVCPYCGAKNEQGITICEKCGGHI